MAETGETNARSQGRQDSRKPLSDPREDCSTCSVEAALNLVYNRINSAHPEARPVKTYTESAVAAALDLRWGRQPPFSPPLVRLRTDPSRFCETDPFSPRPSRHKSPQNETNPFSSARLRTPPPHHKPPLRNKPIFGRAGSATSPQRRSAPTGQHALRPCVKETSHATQTQIAPPGVHQHSAHKQGTNPKDPAVTAHVDPHMDLRRCQVPNPSDLRTRNAEIARILSYRAPCFAPLPRYNPMKRLGAMGRCDEPLPGRQQRSETVGRFNDE